MKSLDRLDELLADRAVIGLDEVEENELQSLLAQHGHSDVAAYERAVAALHVSMFEVQPVQLPPDIRSRLIKQAEAFQTGRLGAEPKPQPAPVRLRAVPARPLDHEDEPEARSLLAGPLPAWLVAAAAVLITVFSVFGGEASGPATSLTVAELRAELMTRGLDVVQIDWTATDDPLGADVGGDVIWDEASQEGVMRFVGLQPNDASKNQYQLWIFDEERKAEHPVDGGVFDVGENGEVLVPIEAKLPVANPTLFAITLEQPGGVVVSERDRLLLLAQRQL